MEEVAYAKINLALHVRGREPHGYHRIETLFAFAQEGDLLRVAPSDRLELAVEGPFAADLDSGVDNLVMRAAAALQSRYAVGSGAALTLDKRLPIASGIGGGSADAAAALRLLDRWWRLGADEGVLLEIAATLGADVPACVSSETARGEGRGDRLERQREAAIAAMPLLLVNPRVALGTGDVFRAWDGVDRGGLPSGTALDIASLGRNDLEQPAISRVPEIREVLSILSQQPGARLVRMSGSGATCFALFDSIDDRHAAERRIRGAHPDWWQLATRLR